MKTRSLTEGRVSDASEDNGKFLEEKLGTRTQVTMGKRYRIVAENERKIFLRLMYWMMKLN